MKGRRSRPRYPKRRGYSHRRHRVARLTLALIFPAAGHKVNGSHWKRKIITPQRGNKRLRGEGTPRCVAAIHKSREEPGCCLRAHSKALHLALSPPLRCQPNHSWMSCQEQPCSSRCLLLPYHIPWDWWQQVKSIP